MTIPDPERYRTATLSYLILFAICGFLTVAIVFAFIFFYTSPNPSAVGIIIAIGLLAILGNYGFNYLENAAKFKPPPRTTTSPEIDLFSSALKNGSEVHVTLAVYYFSELDSPNALQHIKIQLERALNIHFLKIGSLTLTDETYTDFDDLFAHELETIRQELGITKITCRTMKVKISEKTDPAITGVWLGDKKTPS
jgi:hypothetical protein